MGLEEMFARMAAEGGDGAPKVSHVGQIARLREFKDRLEAGNQFGLGDLVTVRRDAPVRGVGQPHLVVETRDAPEPDFVAGETGTVAHGARRDIRVVAFHGEHIAMHWVESVNFEPYDAAVHEKSDSEREYEAA